MPLLVLYNAKHRSPGRIPGPGCCFPSLIGQQRMEQSRDLEHSIVTSLSNRLRLSTHVRKLLHRQRLFRDSNTVNIHIKWELEKKTPLFPYSSSISTPAEQGRARAMSFMQSCHFSSLFFSQTYSFSERSVTTCSVSLSRQFLYIAIARRIN